MNFEIIRDNLIILLGANADGRFTTIGYKQRTNSADLNRDSLRTVQVIFNSGKFPQSSASLHGPYQHNISFEIVLIASSAAKGDLTVLNNPAATEGEVAAALANIQSAEYLANRSCDELYGIVSDIIMSASSVDVGGDFNVANRWVTDFRKSKILRYGEVAVVPGIMTFECRIDEASLGEEYIGVLEVLDTTLEFPGDAVQQSGTLTEYTFLVDSHDDAYLVDKDENLITDEDDE